MIFVIIKIMHLNACVSSEKEKVKESQSRSMTPSLDTPLEAGLGRHNLVVSEQRFRHFLNCLNIDIVYDRRDRKVYV